MKKPSINGVINVDKPPGITSHDVVAHIRRLLQQPRAKAGHTGTLDPLATGVLLVAIGQATRLIEYSHDWDKEYEATFMLGAMSDTDDATGEIKKIENRNRENRTPNKAKIKNTLTQFVGIIEQTPPDYSAVKIKGQKAYDLARRGQALRLKPRSVTIHNIEFLFYDYPRLRLRITCGTGTYIRSLARDIGIVLGTGAYVETLRRTRIGQFTAKQSCQLDQLTENNLSSFIHKGEILVSHLPTVNIADAEIAAFNQGKSIKIILEKTPLDRPLAVYGTNHTLLGIATITSPNILVPQKVLLMR